MPSKYEPLELHLRNQPTSLLISKLTVIVTIISIFWPSAHATPFVDSCHPEPDEYEYLVEQHFRDAWHTRLEPLIMRFALPGRTETAIALSRNEFGFSLVRLQFDRSLWYESWVEVGNSVEQDFSAVPIRVAATSIPIPNRIAESLVEAYEVVEVSENDDRGDIIILDGVGYSIVQSDGTCLSLHSPPQESYAGRIMELFWLLDAEVPAWRPERRNEFESSVFRRFSELPESE